MNLLLTGALLSSLMPRGYALLEHGRAAGDLNRDGRPDIALAVKRRDEDKIARTDLGNVPPRLLLVFFRQPNGKYRRAFTNNTAVLKRNEGGMMGDPWQGLQIERGALVLHHSGGSREVWTYAHRFRFDSAAWRLIGFRRATFDRLNGDQNLRDTNLLTGAVTTRAFKGVNGRQKQVGARSFHELRVVPAGRVAPVLVMRASGCTARVAATLQNNVLTVRADVQDDLATGGDTLAVLRSGQRSYTPLLLRKVARRGGYTITARYAWKPLNAREDYTDESLLSGSRDMGLADEVCDASVVIVDKDAASQPARALVAAAQIRLVARRAVVLPPLPSRP